MSVSVKVLEVVDGKKRVVLNGIDYGTEVEFDNAEYFVSDERILFDDGTPLECESDFECIAIRNSIRLNNI